MGSIGPHTVYPCYPAGLGFSYSPKSILTPRFPLASIQTQTQHGYGQEKHQTNKNRTNTHPESSENREGYLLLADVCIAPLARIGASRGMARTVDPEFNILRKADCFLRVALGKEFVQVAVPNHSSSCFRARVHHFCTKLGLSTTLQGVV